MTEIDVFYFYAQLGFNAGEVEVSFENNDLSEPSGCLYTLGRREFRSG